MLIETFLGVSMANLIGYLCIDHVFLVLVNTREIGGISVEETCRVNWSNVRKGLCTGILTA